MALRQPLWVWMLRRHATSGAHLPVHRSFATGGCCGTGGMGDAATNAPLLWSQLPPAPLRHHYFALRHGQSIANVAGTISSDPSIATVVHGLTDTGKEQAAAAAGALAPGLSWGGSSGGPTHLVIYSSDYTRAWETAEIFAAGVRAQWAGTAKVVVGPTPELRLRERWFGEYDGTPDSPEAVRSLGGYPAVWAKDIDDATQTERGVESVAAVLGRASAVVAELEALAGPPLLGSARGCGRMRRAAAASTAAAASATDDHSSSAKEEERWAVVLVAHGDVLQILQTGFAASVEPSQHRSLPPLPNAQLRYLNDS